jgi:hypothetical protein
MTNSHNLQNFPEIVCYTIGHDYIDGICQQCGQEIEEEEVIEDIED